MKTPSTTKEWVKDVKWALNEAVSIHEESIRKNNEFPRSDLYKMASSIGLIYRNINDEKLKEELIEKTWGMIIHVHNEIPAFKSKYKRCFAHAYLDTMIHLKLMSVAKAEKVIDILERQGKVEH